MDLDAPVREVLLHGVDFFVRRAVHLNGVQKIALVGSLASTKPAPKDADIVVWVEDAMDLAPLAALGRQLIGRMQSHGRGADIFLVNSRSEYIGRTCLWKECRPGIRAACDADHCGQRPYLHDDLGTVSLTPQLLADSSVVLWPDGDVELVTPMDLGALIQSWRGAI